jgi:hypothetical protein
VTCNALHWPPPSSLPALDYTPPVRTHNAGLPTAEEGATAEAAVLERLLEDVRQVALATDTLYELDVLHIGDDDK